MRSLHYCVGIVDGIIGGSGMIERLFLTASKTLGMQRGLSKHPDVMNKEEDMCTVGADSLGWWAPYTTLNSELEQLLAEFQTTSVDFQEDFGRGTQNDIIHTVYSRAVQEAVNAAYKKSPVSSGLTPEPHLYRFCGDGKVFPVMMWGVTPIAIDCNNCSESDRKVHEKRKEDWINAMSMTEVDRTTAIGCYGDCVKREKENTNRTMELYNACEVAGKNCLCDLRYSFGNEAAMAAAYEIRAKKVRNCLHPSPSIIQQVKYIFKTKKTCDSGLTTATQVVQPSHSSNSSNPAPVNVFQLNKFFNSA